MTLELTECQAEQVRLAVKDRMEWAKANGYGSNNTDEDIRVNETRVQVCAEVLMRLADCHGT